MCYHLVVSFAHVLSFVVMCYYLSVVLSAIQLLSCVVNVARCVVLFVQAPAVLEGLGGRGLPLQGQAEAGVPRVASIYH